MRVFIDTNVLISAAINPSGTSAQALAIVADRHTMLISQDVLFEGHAVVERKFPSRLKSFDSILLLFRFELVTPTGKVHEGDIRDPNDLPILDAAISGGADVLLTGDKDFSGIQRPEISILSPTDFVALCG